MSEAPCGEGTVSVPVIPSDWAFHHHYHSDRANAAIHMSPVRFSPITFALAKELIAGCKHIEEVLGHAGKYPEDRGRIELDPTEA